MKFRNNILKIALCIGGAFFLFIPLSFSQEYIELLDGAEEIKLDGASGNYIITGDVVFKKDNTKLYCDSAYYNIARDYIRAFGNIHLNKQDTLNMYCDSIHFDTKKEYAKLYGNVRIRNNEYKLTTDSLDYDLKKNVGVYKNYGTITSIESEDKLFSRIGYFYPNREQFNFRDSVLYTNEDFKIITDTLQFNGRNKIAHFFGPTTVYGDSLTMYCEKGWYDTNKEKGVFEQNAWIDRGSLLIQADSLYYSSIDSLYIGKYRVKITDTTNKLGFQSDYAYQNEKEKYSFITGHALMKKFGQEDTLYIHADTLHAYNDSVGDIKFIYGTKNVKLFQGELQGVGDSITYDKRIGEMNLYHDPILWAKTAQLSGDTITIYEKNDQLDRAFIRKKGLITSHVDSTNYYNQIAGTFLYAYFDSTKIKKVDLISNAMTIYFIEQEEENDSTIIVTRKGMNRLYSSDITLRFEDGDIKTATYRESPEGRIYPMDQINKEEERVEYFKWEIDKRPLSWQEMIHSPEEKKQFLEIYQLIWSTLSFF